MKKKKTTAKKSKKNAPKKKRLVVKKKATKAKTKPKKKTAKSKATKKPQKKSVAKTGVARKGSTPVRLVVEELKPIGMVTHFFNDIDVAIVKFNVPIVVGTAVHFKGATTNFKSAIQSMQYEHQPITTAKKGQEVGIKVKKRVRVGDRVHFA